MLLKDEVLDRLAEVGNVAQFVSMRPEREGLVQSFSRIASQEPNHVFGSVHEAVGALLESSSEGRVNVRSYLPNDPRSREFVYGLTSVDEVCKHLDRLGSEGLWLIVNETVDIEDGGISGVLQGDIVEFAPDDTPRAVEKPGACALPSDLGITILRTVYGFAPDFPDGREARIEFSIHPRPRGWRGTRTLLWEYEENAGVRTSPLPSWPNRFSRHLGDKTFGLLLGEALKEKVPRTIAITRRVAPFSFGTPTGWGEVWMRTAPREQRPGLHDTTRGWTDPFALLAQADAEGDVAAVLSQEGVRALWSGAAITRSNGVLLVEGVRGYGDTFMLGERQPEEIDAEVQAAVRELARRLSVRLGPSRFEWVWDGSDVWLVQLHSGSVGSHGDVIVPGEAVEWMEIDAGASLDELRSALSSMPKTHGVLVRGRFGLTSHKADVLRKSERPARFLAADEQ